MAGSFALTLDTTPPQITRWGPARIDHAGALLVPYELSEPAITAATVNGQPAEIGTGLLRLNDGPRYGEIVLTLSDDVGNQASARMRFNIGPLGRMLAAAKGAMTAARSGRSASGEPGRVSRPDAGWLPGGQTGTVEGGTPQ